MFQQGPNYLKLQELLLVDHKKMSKNRSRTDY